MTVLVTKVTDVPVTPKIKITGVSVATVVTKVSNVSTVTLSVWFIKDIDRPKTSRINESKCYTVTLRTFRNLQYYPSGYTPFAQAVFLSKYSDKVCLRLLFFPCALLALPMSLTFILSPYSCLPYIMPVVWWSDWVTPRLVFVTM
jgi:hypothetical protein